MCSIIDVQPSITLTAQVDPPSLGAMGTGFGSRGAGAPEHQEVPLDSLYNAGGAPAGHIVWSTCKVYTPSYATLMALSTNLTWPGTSIGTRFVGGSIYLRDKALRNMCSIYKLSFKEAKHGSFQR